MCFLSLSNTNKNTLFWFFQEDPRYILTKTIQQHLNNLARIVMARKYPVLLQGPTSSGKVWIVFVRYTNFTQKYFFSFLVWCKRKWIDCVNCWNRQVWFTIWQSGRDIDLFGSTITNTQTFKNTLDNTSLTLSLENWNFRKEFSLKLWRMCVIHPSFISIFIYRYLSIFFILRINDHFHLFEVWRDYENEILFFVKRVTGSFSTNWISLLLKCWKLSIDC